MSRRNPSHPGTILRELCIRALGLSVTEAAEGLGVSRVTLSRLLNGRAGVSPEMAVRLAKALGSTPEHWLRLQMQYDIRQAERNAGKIRVKRFAGPALAAD